MLKVDSVSLRYNVHAVLKGAFLECHKGEVVGLLGRNGSGKSTLLKIIFGTVAGNYKHVSVDGTVVNKGYHYNKIAYLPQHHYLPPALSIKKLAMQLVKPEDWREFEALSLFQLYSSQRPRQLSGGELRQIELLLVLYSKADYVLLDEPFTQLSPVQADEFKLLIKERSQTKGIIITDHQYQNIIEVSQRLYLIDKGYTHIINNMDDLITYGYISASNT